MAPNDPSRTTHEDRPAAVAAFAGPIVFFLALLYHPFILMLTNDAHVVEELQGDPRRWFLSHLLVAIGAAGVLLAFLGVRTHIRRSIGDERWTARAVPPLVVATVLFTLLPGMEIAMLAPNAAGADMVATQAALNTWFRPILLVGSALFALGAFLFAHGVRRANVLPPAATWAVVVALSIAAVSRFIPMTPSLIVGAAGLVLAFFVLGLSMWQAKGGQHAQAIVA